MVNSSARKTKLLVFHQALAPYRIDLWNCLNKIFNLSVYFAHQNVPEQKFDQNKLRSMLDFRSHYLTKGFTINNRAFRFIPFSFLNDKELDVVFTYEYSQTTILVALLKLYKGLTYKHYTLCDDSLDIAENCKGLRKIARNFIINKLDGIIVVNEDVAKWYSSNFILKSTPFVLPIIYNQEVFSDYLKNSLSISNTLLSDYSLIGKKIIFYVGRLEKIKGIDRLLAAFSMLKLDNNIHLVIIGEGSEKENLHNLSHNLGINSNTHFTGKLVGPSLYAWYNIGQVFVLPSSYEPFGAVVSEALQSGARVLCSSLAGASGLIDNSNGSIFDPYNIENLAKLLKEELDKQESIEYLTEIRGSKIFLSLENKVMSLYTHILKTK